MLVSVGWSALGASATVALAWPLAWFSRRSIPWQGAAIACAALTLATPGPVAGMGLVLAYRQVPWAYGSALMLVHADLLRTLPYALLLLWPSLRAIPPEYLDAAALDGYGAWGRIRRVALPLTRDATDRGLGRRLRPGPGGTPRDQPGVPAGRDAAVGPDLEPAALGRREPPGGRRARHARRRGRRGPPDGLGTPAARIARLSGDIGPPVLDASRSGNDRTVLR